MINKRKKYSEGEDALADVNEQELAKDTERPIYTENMGTVSAQAQPVPENFSQDKIEQATDFVILEQTAGTALVEQNGETSVVSDNRENMKDNTQADTDEVSDDEQAPPTKRDKRTRGTGVYAAVIIICLVASIALVVFARFSDEVTPIDTEILTDAPLPSDTAPLTPDISDAENVYSAAVRSAVTVVTTRNGEKSFYSGVAVFDGGYIATLYEAVSEGAVEVLTSDGVSFPATVVDTNPEVNLALLSTNGVDLPSVNISHAADIFVGDSVFAIGNIGDGLYPSSLVAARVSYKQRAAQISFPDGVLRTVNAIQLDMTTHAGMGGCPIFDRNGAVLAMALTSSGGACLAYSMEDVLPVLECMRDGREPEGGIVSVLAKQLPCLGILGEQAEHEGVWGVVINGFEGQGTDAAVSLRKGDLVFKIGEQLVADTETLKNTMQTYSVGDTVEVFVLRNSQRLSFFVTLGTK